MAEEMGMKLPEGEVWLLLAGCVADCLRGVCSRVRLVRHPEEDQDRETKL